MTVVRHNTERFVIRVAFVSPDYKTWELESLVGAGAYSPLHKPDLYLRSLIEQEMKGVWINQEIKTAQHFYKPVREVSNYLSHCLVTVKKNT